MRRYPGGIAEKYTGRVRNEIERCWHKVDNEKCDVRREENGDVVDRTNGQVLYDAGGLNGNAAPQEEEPEPDAVAGHQRKGALLRWFGDEPPEPPRWLVKGILPETGVAIVSGQWGAGKTFIANNLSAAVLTGTPFAEEETHRRGGILWLAAEGESEIDNRMSAAIDATPLPDGAFSHSQMPFCVQQNEVPSLTDGDAFDRLNALADEASTTMRDRFNADLALIIIDTLAAAASFGDENSASETQAVMNVLRRLSKHTKALVLVIDHHGKVAETGVRGSSAKSGAADAILAVLADKAFEGTITNRRVAIVKLRGGPTGAVMPFSLRGVPLSDGDATTCVVEWGGETLKIVTVKAERSPWTGKSRILKKAIEVALIERGVEIATFRQ